jgi:hypothetical protein
MAKKSKEKAEKAEKPAPKPRPVVERRPKPPRGPGEPVYTVMAAVTLLAMLVGCALLYLDYDEYSQKAPPGDKIPALPRLVDDAKAAPGG